MAQEEIIFKVGVDTGDSVQDVNKVGDAIENVGKDAKKTDGSFVNLKKELKNLTVQLQNLDPASKEFETVAKRAGQIKEQMRGVADAINDADPEKFGGKFQRTAEGIAGAFSAVTGAQALFGQQSEEIEKQMLRVQGAIALTQGISAMKELKNDALDFATSIKTKLVGAFTSLTAAELTNAEATGTMTLLQKAYALAVGTSTGAMKVFRLALVSTGIGALVVAVGFLIEKIAGFVSNTDEATKAQNRFTTATKKYNDEQERTRSNMDKQIQFQLDFAKAVGASEEKQYEIQKSGLRKREILRQSDFEMNKLHIQYLKQQKKDAIEEENEELVKSINEEITKTKEKNNDLISLKYQLQQDDAKLTAQYNTDLKNKQNDANKEALVKQKENSQKNKEQREKEAQERLALQRKIEDLTVANIDDANARDIMSLKLKHDRELEEMQKQYGKKKEFAELENQLLIQQENERKALEEEQKKAKDEKAKAEIEKANNDAKALLEAEIIRAEEDFNLKQQKRIELENLDFAQQMANTELTNGEREILKAQHEANLVGIAKDSADRQKEIDEATKQSKMELMNAVGSIFGELAGLSKQASAVQKAFAITQVAIDTATALSGLTSISFSPTNGDNSFNPLGPYIKLATGTAKIISNMARVKSILGSGVSVAPPTTGGGQNANLGIGANQQGTQQTVQAQSTYKVVVVDSDITKMQDKTKKVNAISTI
jgi:hypothetical protein